MNNHVNLHHLSLLIILHLQQTLNKLPLESRWAKETAKKCVAVVEVTVTRSAKTNIAGHHIIRQAELYIVHQ